MIIQIPILLAEVSDKIPSKGEYLIVCAGFLILVMGFARQRWLWPMLLEFTIIAIGIIMIAQQVLFDRIMRECIIAEQGVSYYLIAFASLTLPIITGLIMFIKRKE